MSEFNYPVVDNRVLNETSSKFQMPTVVKSTIMSDGYGRLNTVNVVGLRMTPI